MASTNYFLPLGGFVSVSLSVAYLRNNNIKKATATAVANANTALVTGKEVKDKDTLRTIPDNASASHGIPHLFKSLEAAALMLRLGSDTLRRSGGLSHAELKRFLITVCLLEQRVQLGSSHLQRTVVIEGLQGELMSEALFFQSSIPSQASRCFVGD